METAIYNDFELRKGKAKGKRGARKAPAEEADKSAVVESVVSAVVAGEQRVQQMPEEEIRELGVVRIPANPRLVLANYEQLDGVQQLVRVWVGINRNFKPRMRLKARRGESENAPWRLVGKRPRLPGRW